MERCWPFVRKRWSHGEWTATISSSWFLRARSKRWKSLWNKRSGRDVGYQRNKVRIQREGFYILGRKMWCGPIFLKNSSFGRGLPNALPWDESTPVVVFQETSLSKQLPLERVNEIILLLGERFPKRLFFKKKTQFRGNIFKTLFLETRSSKHSFFTPRNKLTKFIKSPYK